METKLAILRSYIQEMYNDSTQLPRVGKLFDVLIDQHPHEHDIHALYSRYLIVTQDYAKAAEQTERALDLDPADEEGWEMLTSLYLQENKLDEAKAAIKRSFRYYPENGRQYLVLGSIHDQQGRTRESAQEYERALELTDSTDTKTISRIYGRWAITFMHANCSTALSQPIRKPYSMIRRTILRSTTAHTISHVRGATLTTHFQWSKQQ